MTNHPNRSKVSYLRYCPRGFANEVVFFRVRPEEIPDAESFAAEVNDGVNGHAIWTTEAKARVPGVAVEWRDKDWL